MALAPVNDDTSIVTAVTTVSTAPRDFFSYVVKGIFHIVLYLALPFLNFLIFLSFVLLFLSFFSLYFMLFILKVNLKKYAIAWS
jgi:hypothetical protein